MKVLKLMAGSPRYSRHERRLSCGFELFNSVHAHHGEHDPPSNEEQQVQKTPSAFYRTVSSGVDGPLDGLSIGVGSVHVDELILGAGIGDIDRYGATELVDLKRAVVVRGNR